MRRVVGLGAGGPVGGAGVPDTQHLDADQRSQPGDQADGQADADERDQPGDDRVVLLLDFAIRHGRDPSGAMSTTRPLSPTRARRPNGRGLDGQRGSQITTGMTRSVQRW